MRRSLATLLALTAALAALASCSPSRPTVTIGALYPRSGPQGGGGSEEERGVRLAVEWANEHGGVGGRTVVLRTADAVRAEAVPDAVASLRRQGASVIIGSHGSAVSAVAARAATEAGLVFWETGAVGETSSEVAGGRNFFRLAPMGASLGRAAIAFVRDTLAERLPRRPTRYAVAQVDDPYGRAVGQGAADEVRSGGQELVGTFAYDAQRSDFAALAGRIAASRPDVLFVAAYLDDGVALRRALADAGVPLLASIGTSSSYCMPAFGERLGAGAVGLFASDKPDGPYVRPEALLPEGRRTLDWATSRYRARYHEAMSAPALAGFANAYALVGHVLERAPDGRAGAVARAALAVKLPKGALANGSGLDLAPPDAIDAGANRAAASVIWEWVGPGERAVVWPPAFATHSIVVDPAR